MPGALHMVSGTRYERLVLIERAPNVERRQAWLCSCDCGKQKTVLAKDLVRGFVKSCGCLHLETSTARIVSLATKHGRSFTPEHYSWGGMLARCTNPRNKDYPRYGGRGIRVHESWTGPDGFAAFFEHIGPKPSPQHSVDRIDNSRGYEPGNVRWATIREQSQNKRTNRQLTAFGKTQCIAEWAREYGLDRSTLRLRIDSGMPTEMALTRPSRSRRPTCPSDGAGQLMNSGRRVKARRGK